jgi:hydroxylamine reductase
MEQKAVAILWSLLTLDLSDIYSGSILPALVNDDILKVLRAN